MEAVGPNAHAGPPWSVFEYIHCMGINIQTIGVHVFVINLDGG